MCLGSDMCIDFAMVFFFFVVCVDQGLSCGLILRVLHEDFPSSKASELGATTTREIARRRCKMSSSTGWTLTQTCPGAS